MAMKVLLQIAEGALKGKETSIKCRSDGSVMLSNGIIAIEGHEVVVFGRHNDCHVQFPEDDLQISRHHFILETNPPHVRVRDLGSLNGTHIRRALGGDWEEIGRRKNGETPEEGAKRRYRDVDLGKGDQIQVGQTGITVSLESQVVCLQCGGEIANKDQAECAWPGGTFMCNACRGKAAISYRPGPRMVCHDCGREIVPGKIEWGGRHHDDDFCRECWEIGYQGMMPAQERLHREAPRCKKCGKDVKGELGGVRRGDYICASCQEKAAEDPAELLYLMLRQAGLIEGNEAKPEVPGYEIGELIGRGGCGAVYLAKCKKDQRELAIKVMLSKVAVSEKERSDFLREIEITRTLKGHPNIVTLLDYGAAGTGFYFVMEYYPAGSVINLMEQRGGKLSVSDAEPIMLQAMDGLIHMHNERFVHRDLKPDNLLLDKKGGNIVAKISDLGLSKNFEKAGFSGYTVTGQYAGTYQFMPREQLLNFKYVRPVSDIWSMGATFYYMLTADLPQNFPHNKDPATVLLHDDIVPIRKRDPSVPKKLAAAIDKAIAKEIKARFQTAQEMKRALQAAL